jgi:hypothetical protein
MMSCSSIDYSLFRSYSVLTVYVYIYCIYKYYHIINGFINPLRILSIRFCVNIPEIPVFQLQTIMEKIKSPFSFVKIPVFILWFSFLCCFCYGKNYGSGNSYNKETGKWGHWPHCNLNIVGVIWFDFFVR